MIAAIHSHLRVDAIRRPPKRHLTEGNQITRPKEVRHRSLSLVREVHLTLIQARKQLARISHQPYSKKPRFMA
jgi:hypothetical protein